MEPLALFLALTVLGRSQDRRASSCAQLQQQYTEIVTATKVSIVIDSHRYEAILSSERSISCSAQQIIVVELVCLNPGATRRAGLDQIQLEIQFRVGCVVRSLFKSSWAAL